MIKSTTTTQELRLQRPGQSPVTIDSLKTTFLPNLSMDGGGGAEAVSAFYCPLCGQQYARQQLLEEHMQICHAAAAGNVMPPGHAGAAQPPPASLKIEYPCLSCDDKFPSATDLDEHSRIAHQAFLARCLSCGLYGISSTSLQEGSAGGEYKCMHCGALCSAAALDGQQAYLEQPSTYMDSQSQPEEESHDDDGEEEDEDEEEEEEEENDDDDEQREIQQQSALEQQQHPQHQQPPSLKVPPLTVKMPKNSDSEHPHVIIKQEPLNHNEANGCTPPSGTEAVILYGTETATMGSQQQALQTSVVVSACSTMPSATTSTISAAAAVINNKMRHKCPDCPKTFKTPGTLATHRKVHNGDADQTPKERPYICTYCGKSFTQSNTLKQHTRIHTGEKPFHCAYCEKSFSVKDYLTKHIRTHTGEKPYTCSYCDKKFTQRSALTVHTTKLHPL